MGCCGDYGNQPCLDVLVDPLHWDAVIWTMLSSSGTLRDVRSFEVASQNGPLNGRFRDVEISRHLFDGQESRLLCAWRGWSNEYLLDLRGFCRKLGACRAAEVQRAC